jgi:hypothetical protein
MLHPAAFFCMYLLYLDDSGSVRNPEDRHIVLAGLAVYERQPHWFSSRLDTIAERVWPSNPQGLEFRGTDILAGKKHWKAVLFGAVVHKAAISPNDPMEYAFEQVCNRFDIPRLIEVSVEIS